MKDNMPTFLDEAIRRREAIANQLAHLDVQDNNLRRDLERNARSRAELLNIDAGYADAIVRMTPH